MPGLLIAVEIAGHVVRLPWGMRMVRSGVERAFGSDRRRILGRANPASRRVPVGNLLFRATGCAAVLPFVDPIATAPWREIADPRAALTGFHLAPASI